MENKPVEFGAKLSVSLDGDGFARVDHLRWNAFHEGLDLKSQVEAYRERMGHYPERVSPCVRIVVASKINFRGAKNESKIHRRL